MRTLKVHCTKESLLNVRRSSRWKQRMVYILVANKSYKYKSGKRSHVIYIGTTGKGARRPAASAIDKASEAFAELRGVKEIGVHIASCRGRKAMKTWEHLESALLATFRDMHYELPKYNKRRGSGYKEDRLFRRRALESVIRQFAN